METDIIAHDVKKGEMVQFLNEHNAILLQKIYHLFRQERQVKKVKKAGFDVMRLLSGPLGGDAQIAARVEERKCNMVLFIRDPLEKHPHEPDVVMLMRLCDVHDVPLVTNPAAAQLLIKGL